MPALFAILSFLSVTGDPTLRDRVAAATANPNVAFVLAAAGLVAIYAECCSPGLILPGALGGIALVVGLYALCRHPLQWTGVALLLAGLALFAADAFAGARGFLGALGACAFAFGAIHLIAPGSQQVRIRPLVAWSVALPLAAISVFLATAAVRARANKQAAAIESSQSS